MILRKIVIRFCNDIRHFSNEINKRGGGIFFLRRVEFFKIGKRGLHVYSRDESKSTRNYEKNNVWNIRPLVDELFVPMTQQARVLH